MNLTAQYVSNWDEGEVTTSCNLDLMTGNVSNVETSDEHDHFEHHNYDEVLVTIGNKQLSGRIDSDNNKVQDIDLTVLKGEAIKALKGDQY